MADSAPAAPAAPAAAAPAAGQPTHVSQSHVTDHQALTPPAPAAPAKAGDPPAAPPAAPDPAAKPDAAAMKAYLTEKAKDVSLEGKSDADIAQLYADTKAKEPATTEFKLPDEYKDKPWAAKVKSLDDLYKQIDTLDALKGKKMIVPNLKDATPEEREAFYSQLRGKDASEYPIPDNKAFPTLPETQGVVAKLFMDNGVAPVQAENIIKGYQELGAKQLAEQFNPDGFKKSMETAFGPEWEKTTGQVRNTIKGMMNADDQLALERLPNHILGTVYRTLGNTIKAFGVKETDTAHFGPGGKVAPSDVVSVRQGLRDQLAALSMRPHTSVEQQGIIDQLNKTYENDPRLQQA